MLTAVPFGASAQDNGEFMLGTVLVSLVLMESDGSVDANTEDWTTDEITALKEKVTTGVEWWSEVLARQNSVHSLDFRFDFTHADTPINTGYEPISRPSDDFDFWLEDFFEEVDIAPGSSFSDRIHDFNHRQREAHNTNWAFTIFAVDDTTDADGRFANGSHAHAFAFAGGRFFVTPGGRPASTIAHETGHMFWAADEYLNGKSYEFRRGYYNAANADGFRDNPNPDFNLFSMMQSPAAGYPIYSTSPSSMEMIGWRDTDGDGVFDVLDVEHLLIGEGSYSASSNEYQFDGLAQVQTLANANSSGTGNSMTINTIDAMQVRFDDGAWQTLQTYGTYQADVSLQFDVPEGTTEVAIRAVDFSNGVESNLFVDQLDTTERSWQNPANELDVNNDGRLTAFDALLVINELNSVPGARELDATIDAGLAFVDTNDDGSVTPFDALLVINGLNRAADANPVSATTSAEGEPSDDVAAAVAPTTSRNDVSQPRTLTSQARIRMQQLLMRRRGEPFAGATRSVTRPATTVGTARHMAVGSGELADVALVDMALADMALADTALDGRYLANTLRDVGLNETMHLETMHLETMHLETMHLETP